MKINYFALPGLVGLKDLRVNTVKSVVLENLGVSWESLIGESRLRPLPDARKMFAYCIRKYCGKVTSIALGKLINKDHATILYYYKRTEHLREYDAEFRETLELIKYKINEQNRTI